MKKADKYTKWLITFLCEKEAIKFLDTEEVISHYEEESLIVAFNKNQELAERNSVQHKKYEPEWESTEGVHIGTLIEFICRDSTPMQIKTNIKDTFVKIDFANGNIYHFLQHLATGYILQVEKWAEEEGAIFVG